MIEVNHLAFSYSEKDVLRDITFKAEEGDVLAVLGRNAAGKTTLMNVMTGILEPNGGTVIIDEEEINQHLSDRLKREVGVMRPITGVFEKMKVYDYLEFVGALYGINRERIHELAHEYSFESELDRQIKKTSAGTRKKIEFAASIIHRPNILFLDEPFESVDPVVVKEMKDYIRKFVAEKKTLIITSHILDIIQNIANKCIIIDDGRVIYSGDVSSENESLEKVFLDVVKNYEE